MKEGGAPEEEPESYQLDGLPFHRVPDPAEGLLASLDTPGAARDDPASQEVYILEHDVPWGQGRIVRLREHFTKKAWDGDPRRALLMLSSFNRESFSIPVEGYNATKDFAHRGFFVFTADTIGMGESYRPENGQRATYELNIEAFRAAIRYIRSRRSIAKIDLYGEGYGSTLACSLAEDDTRLQSCILSAILYNELAGGPITSPDFQQMIKSVPDGYYTMPPEALTGFMEGAPPEAIDYFVSTQAQPFPVTIFLLALELPFYDPAVARIPGLVINGAQDPVVTPAGVAALARGYGAGGAELILLEKAGHGPRLESPETASRFWSEVSRFLNLDPE